MPGPNPFLLAADNPAQLLSLLQEQPELASAQDDHGYSLIHAAASYNHIDLLRALVTQFKADVNLKDEDNETALFVVETPEVAKVLVEELHADPTIRGDEGTTAREKIEAEGEFPEVAAYLLTLEDSSASHGSVAAVNGAHPAPVPQGLEVNVGTMNPDEVDAEDVDPELKRLIDELAARPDFHEESGQQALRELIAAALSGQIPESRDVRQRTD